MNRLSTFPRFRSSAHSFVPQAAINIQEFVTGHRLLLASMPPLSGSALHWHKMRTTPLTVEMIRASALDSASKAKVTEDGNATSANDRIVTSVSTLEVVEGGDSGKEEVVASKSSMDGGVSGKKAVSGSTSVVEVMQVGGGNGKEEVAASASMMQGGGDIMKEKAVALDRTIKCRKEDESRPLTTNEKTLKRNTDCLYFLASPLACKEGSECEYRHSKDVRLNLSDCRYWLNGNCLNSKYPFRHLPHDCLMGIQGTASKPTPCERVSIHKVPTPGSSALNNPKKQNISCFFFQRGQCLKGDKCPFMHRPQPFGIHPMNDLPRYTPSYIPVGKIARSISSSDQSKPTEEHLQNDNDDDDSSRESTPRFDVLVGDNFQCSDYPMEYDFVDELGQGGWNIYPGPEFRYHHSGHEPVINLERETLTNKNNHKHELDETMKSHICSEQKKTSSEKYMDRELKLEKRVRSREETPEEIDSSDLCHRQLKQRRLDNSNSIVSCDGHGDPYFMEDCYSEGEGYHGRHYNDDQRNFPLGCSTSDRLQGRITLPATKSPDRPVDEWSERQLSREMQRDRLSTTRPASYRERHGERLKDKLPDEFATDAKNFGSQFVRRADSKSLNFSGHCMKFQQHFPPVISMSAQAQGRTKSSVRKSLTRPVDERFERCRLSSTRPTSYQESYNDRLKCKQLDSKPLNYAGPKTLAELKAAKKVE